MRKLKKTLIALVGLFVPLCASALEQDAEGAYLIGNAQDLVDFSALVNDNSAENAGANALLTADIDMSGIVWTPIGTGDRRYNGTFDGQFHRIKNLVINSDVKDQGLFSVVADATIKHVIIDKSCSVKGSNCATAFAGCCNGSGTLTFIGCGNEANVTGTAANNSAFVGCNYSNGALKVVIKYCYNTGKVSGGWENGIFSGWFANAGEVTASYNTGSIVGADGNQSLGRGIGDGNFYRSYDLNADNNRKDFTILADFADEQASSLPYGAQRRLEIARALATRPKFLLLDEPAAGMNPQESVELLEFIRRLRDEFDLTILLIEHDMKVVMNVCDYIQVLDQGVHIAQGTPAEIKANPRVVEAYLGAGAAEGGAA